MGRFGSVALRLLGASCLVSFIAGLAGCSSSNPVRTTSFPVPASITIAPAPNVSLEQGTYQAFGAIIQSSSKANITEPVFYQSSNTAVVTVAASGLVCAGSWDNLSSPTLCAPGPVGVAQITATAQGVSSPPTTVYVHQRIDKVVVNAFTPPNTPPPTIPCQSVGQNSYYEARAYNRGVDITNTVGPFTWQTLNTPVAKLSNSASVLANLVNGVSQNQVQATASVPGTTPLFASVGTANSIPMNVETCAVESITLSIGNSTSNSTTITPTVVDILNTTVTGVPLTWSSSQPASVSVSNTGVASGAAGGGAASVIASCTPPTCNLGFLPALPIYPQNVIEVVPPGSTSHAATVYVTSKACGTTDNCISIIVPFTSPANTLGNAVALPATPNSLVFNRQGTKAYIGTDSGLFGSKGLMVLDVGSNTVSEFTSTPGKVLTVSPDGTTVIVSDTTDTPNQVFIFDTTRNSSTAFNITGPMVAADFSPDSLKAYIVAGSTLYVYSKLDALQTIPLTAAANDVSFLAEGAFAYLAGGNPNATPAVTVRRTCDNAIATDSNGTAQIIPTVTTPTMIRTLPDGLHVLAIEPPNVDLLSVLDTNDASSINALGCTSPDAPTPAQPKVSNSISSINLGQGNFVPTQLIVSQDGSTAYVITPNLNSVPVFNIGAQTSSSIPLAGNTVALQASLTPDGSFLYVGTSDGTVHAIQIANNNDLLQIPFPQSLCQNSTGKPFGIPCNPDLVAVRP